MSPYQIIILIFLITSFFLDMISSILNWKNHNTKIPNDLADIYCLNEYEKSIRYQKEKAQSGLVFQFIGLIALLSFWAFNGFKILNDYAIALSNSPIVQGLSFFAILFLISFPLSLIEDAYFVFKIEEKYGFNRTTLKTFIFDKIKGIALAIVLGAPILSAAIWFFTYAGENAWFYLFVVLTIVSLIMQYLAPSLIMPIFNKFTPIEEGELKIGIEEFAKKANYPLSGIYIIDGSKRSSKSNAFFTGFGKKKRIALYDTLLEKLSTEEIIAVLAHEIGHYKLKHILMSSIIGLAHSFILLKVFSIFISDINLYKAFGINSISFHCGAVFFGLIYAPIETLISIVFKAISRKNEFSADRFAEKHYSAEKLIYALKKLAKENLSFLTPHKLYVFLNFSHPPLVSRIKALKNVDFNK